MRKRIKSVTVAAAALAALALGGSALASASSSSSSAPEKVSATDPGPAVQQGDQTTPDGAVQAKKTHAVKHGKSHAKKHAKKASAEVVSGSDPAGANDTTSPDPSSASSENAAENAPENASESGPSDGPGGHEDAPGNPNVDNQEEGEH
jgi:hypothetical protein